MPETNIADLIEKQGRAFEEFKSTNDARLSALEKKGAADPLLAEKVDKINDEISRLEELAKKAADAAKVDRLVQEMGVTAKSLDELTAAFKRGAFGRDASGLTEERQAFREWARKGGRASEVKGLRADVDTQGGILAPSEFINQIIKDVKEISPVRTVVRVRQTSTRSVMHPKRTGSFEARWTGELQHRQETPGLGYGMEEIHAHELMAKVPISMVDLEDSAFNMEDELRMEAVEQFALAEGRAVVVGDGVAKPQGILTHSEVLALPSGDANSVTADAILKLTHEGVKTVYARRGTFLLNRRTMGVVRTLKAGDGHYLWRMGIAEGAPNTLAGNPYVEIPDMPDVAANSTPIAFGDFNRAYVMADRISMQMARDESGGADWGQIIFRMRRRVGGQVVQPEAICKLRCEA